MADKIIKLNYVGGVLTVDPPTVKVRKGHSLQFKLGAGPKGGRVKITFEEPELFSKPEFRTGDPDIRVAKNLANSTKFRCEAFDAGGTQLDTKVNEGGVLDPDRGTTSVQN